MTSVVLGLRLATVIMFFAIAFTYVRNAECLDYVHYLRRKSMAAISVGVVFGFSPPRLFELLNDPLPASVAECMRIVGLCLFLAGAMLWARSTIVLKGGDKRLEKRSMWINFALILCCLITGGILR
ncbi:hypothetical protein [Parvimonas sp. D9]|uniref:hypothetical protein n=1 Tax=Parvimonas sp. D9 TaxID=3110689 RepID=UPI002B49EFA2|nr:hypothetical protein [Parvimonas sp. D9]MEB3059334.1 hypothetical protein [Parvimonas sp. D9]